MGALRQLVHAAARRLPSEVRLNMPPARSRAVHAMTADVQEVLVTMTTTGTNVRPGQPLAVIVGAGGLSMAIASPARRGSSPPHL